MEHLRILTEILVAADIVIAMTLASVVAVTAAQRAVTLMAGGLWVLDEDNAGKAIKSIC